MYAKLPRESMVLHWRSSILFRTSIQHLGGFGEIAGYYFNPVHNAGAICATCNCCIRYLEVKIIENIGIVSVYTVCISGFGGSRCKRTLDMLGQALTDLH
jgi:hypothetical protein